MDDRIDSASTALLVVDMQLGAFDGVRIAPLPQAETLLAQARVLIDAARRAQLSVIYVQHRGDIGDEFEPDTSHFDVHPALDPRSGDLFVQKEEGSAFVGTGLEALLKQHGIDRLIVCGLQSEYCITATTRSAIDLGYAPVLAADGHGTRDTDGDAASTITERQNALLLSLGATLLPVRSVVEALATSRAGSSSL